jgi:hypothetical protein
MARKLKTYQTSMGFFDLAIAAPSMKAALEAWGSNSNLFHQGVAKESSDPDVIAAAMSKPGVILRRPVGSNGPARHSRMGRKFRRACDGRFGGSDFPFDLRPDLSESDGGGSRQKGGP